MSWSLSTVLNHKHTPIGIQEDLDALNALPKENIGNQQAIKERDVQILSAIDAVIRVLSDGSTFDSAEEVSVSLSGHANPGNQKSPEWANDYIQISVIAKKYRTE